MAKARVQLRHCETFTGLSGESWTKNQARVLTKQSQITYYKSQPEFVVTPLQEPKSKQAQPGSGSSTEGGGDNADRVSKSRLKRMSNAELVDFAAEKYTLALDEDEMKKDDLIAAILEAQG